MACKIIYKGISYDESDFKSQIERYIAINNLFNENETLANEVYEALGFKEFVNNKSSQVENIEVDGVPNINNEEKSLKLALKGLTPEEKISFCNHFGITMTEENGKKC